MEQTPAPPLPPAPIEPVEEFTDADFIEPQTPIVHWLSTGCTILDLAIADRLPGGFPGGRISQIYGDEATAKTAILAELLGDAQRKKGMAVLDDVEQAWDEYRARLFGVDTSNKKTWWHTASANIEQMFDKTIPTAIKKYEEAKLEGPLVLGEDSLSALSSGTEQKEEIGKSSYGTSRAKVLSQGFRKYISTLLGPSGITLIFIDQTRDNVGVTFGEQTTVSGGRALKFYASVRLKLSYIERILNTNGMAIGVKLGFLVKKNKVGVPFREGEFRLLFDYGIDNTATSLEWLADHDPVLLAEIAKKEAEAKKLAATQGKRTLVEDEDVSEKKKRQKRRIWAWKDLKGSGLYDLVAKVEVAGREKELSEYVEQVWHVVHAPPERKEKVRL